MITPQYLRECLSYNRETGELTWRERPSSHFQDGAKTAKHEAAIWNAKYAEKPAFAGVGNTGYHVGGLSGKKMTAHRVIWSMVHGSFPAGEIDHINGVRTDNRIVNLRDVTRRENAKNISVMSGCDRGVYWYPPTSRWVVKISSEGRSRHVGYYKDKVEAVAARLGAEKELGFHDNHGRSY